MLHICSAPGILEQPREATFLGTLVRRFIEEITSVTFHFDQVTFCDQPRSFLIINQRKIHVKMYYVTSDSPGAKNHSVPTWIGS